MDNGVYGLTKGQSSPTTAEGVITSSTPYGKVEAQISPLHLYMTLGVSFVASSFSSKVRDMASLILQGMEHPGFAIVHVQSPCTTYNNTYDVLKGDPAKGIAPVIYDVPDEHDAADRRAAMAILDAPGLPLGLIYQDPHSVPLDKRLANATVNARTRRAEDLFDTLAI